MTKPKPKPAPELDPGQIHPDQLEPDDVTPPPELEGRAGDACALPDLDPEQLADAVLDLEETS